MKTILITGASGFIGQNLAKEFKNEHTIIGLDTDIAGSAYCEKFYDVNIVQYDKIEEIIAKHAPDIIIHTAAMKSLARCETEKDNAYMINTKASLYLNDLSQKIGAKFIFISSDQVFHGDKPLSEITTKTDPINYYGITKSIAEEEIIKNNSAAICRTALVFGTIPENQQQAFIKLRDNTKLVVQGYIVDHVNYRLRNHKEIILPSDEYCSPTSSGLLVKQVRTIIEKDLNGIFHCCGGERISTFEFGRKIAKKFGLDIALISPEPSGDILRPKDVSMDTKSSQSSLGFEFPNIDTMLETVEVYNDN